ncbi:MAG: hypothetical protein EOR84_35085 [Mesorhizobium sp.]|uniref:hypothetical protein n=1 Tax=Mesorhizobium sp. TaxID=1871066 RepID=UPI000FE7B0F7|nr:hypothetical protein [Mesorhizobium sp.]RWM80765.1 MAG: hypothetical protein EOR84_35085 [Mesorhizobium sp.]
MDPKVCARRFAPCLPWDDEVEGRLKIAVVGIAGGSCERCAEGAHSTEWRAAQIHSGREGHIFLTFPGNISAMPVFNALSGREAQFLCGHPPFGV